MKFPNPHLQNLVTEWMKKAVQLSENKVNSLYIPVFPDGADALRQLFGDLWRLGQHRSDLGQHRSNRAVGRRRGGLWSFSIGRVERKELTK